MGTDTIVSPATPLFPSAVGMIRISGPKAAEIVSSITKRKEFLPRRAHLVDLYDEDGGVIDEAIVIFYPKPNSYTGEDMAEIFTHGNPVLINHVISLCIKGGARMAHEGEFTKRAFLNGKLSLEKAESILSVVNSSTIAGIKASVRVLKGDFERVIKEIRSQLIEVSSDIEASVDFPEDVDTDISTEWILSRLGDVLRKVERIYSSWRSSRMMVSGAICSIIGKPNVGKSSLFNLLVGEARAIISSFPGTTRDYVDAMVDLGGAMVKIIDTAGIRGTEDPIEQEGIRRAMKVSKESDVVLCLFDSASEFCDDDSKAIDVALSSDAELVIFVINKSDIGDVRAYEDILWGLDCRGKRMKVLSISCAENRNIDMIRSAIRDFIFEGGSGEFFALSSRQAGLLFSVMEDIKRAEEFLSHSDYLGGVLHLREALKKIDDVFGVGSLPEVIDSIFKKFCIGK